MGPSAFGLPRNCRVRMLTDLAAHLGGLPHCCGSHLPIDQRLLYPAMSSFSIGSEKPLGLRTPSGLNEHSERHKYATGPVSDEAPFVS